MHIAFLGAARTVTGSQHLLIVNGHRILLDCGLYQGSTEEAYRINKEFEFEPEGIDAVLLSHAHLDHSGNLPNLIQQGYTGPIYATDPTCHLSDLIMRDSGKIQEADAQYLSKKNGGHKIEPLYTSEDAAAVKKQFKQIAYNSPFEVVPGMTAKMVEAGHILGSASIVLDIEEKGQKKKRLWFSGDIGRLNLPLVRDPVLPQDADIIIMECTYGDKSHDDPDEAYQGLRDVLNRTIERGGKVLIPAFAVGRTQEIVYFINQMFENGEVPRVPVFVDSPMATEASQIFQDHPQFFDEEALQFIRSSNSQDPLGFHLLTYIDSVEESKALNDRDEPMVIISTSGMLETGRVVHHLVHMIEDPRSTVLIVSFQAPNTLGRQLLNGADRVKVFGDPFDVKAEVARVSGLSAHAGQDFLTKYALAAKDRVEKVFLVHGEDEPAKALREKLQRAGLESTYYPYPRQTMEI